MARRLKYAELAARPAGPSGSSWGLWGDGDQVGAVNDLHPSDVVRAAQLVRRGAVFSLNWRLDLPSPGFFGRAPFKHRVQQHEFGLDERYDAFWPQGSSQWDSLAHFGHPVHGFYGGRDARALQGPSPENGIDNWARRGIAGRFVLADVGRWRHAQGRPIAYAHADETSAAELRATLKQQETRLGHGDILLVRFGWISWYETLALRERERVASGGPIAPGLKADADMVSYLWDSGVVAVAGDNPALEAHPFDPKGFSLHADLLAMLGVPIGELWALDVLAADCAVDRVYEGLLTSAPLNAPGGIGSPANAVAMK